MIRNISKTLFNKNYLFKSPNLINCQAYQPQLYFQKPLFKFSQENGDNVPQSSMYSPPQIEEKIKQLEEQQPFFDRLIYFDPEVMANVPYPLRFIDPMVENVKDVLVQMHESLGIPWVGVIGLTCLAARTTILPLIYLQIQRANRLTAIAPVLIQYKKLIERSTLPRYQKWGLFAKGTFQIVRKQNLKVFRLFVYNIFHFPIMITMIFGIRRLLVEDSLKNTTFLWMTGLSQPDPYYIIPFLTVGGYYYNFQRFITPENKHTFITKLRNIGQILMILWLPLLCNWPSAIQLYMCSNAIISIIQTTIIISPQFLRFVEPKMLLYQYMLRIVEFDKTQSEALTDSIKNGEESLKDKAISEELLVMQTENMLQKLNAEIYDDLEEKQQSIEQEGEQTEDQKQQQMLQNQELKF